MIRLVQTNYLVSIPSRFDSLDWQKVMFVRVLGQIQIEGKGNVRSIGWRKEGALLAALIISAGKVVLADVLLDQLWGQTGTVGALHTCVSRLRDQMASVAGPGASRMLTTTPGGYRITLPPRSTDAARFESLLSDSYRLDPHDAAETLEEALAYWRGPAYADFTYDDWALGEIRRLEELRLVALARRNDALMKQGRHGEVVAGLEALVTEHPLREELWKQLMHALYCSDRQADAVRCFARYSLLLTEEGLEPSLKIREMKERILRGEPCPAIG